MFVVTSTPRSATGYASLLFKALGIDCTHEKYFRPESTREDVEQWCAKGGDVGESSWLAWSFLDQLPESVTVLHSVRNPWSVIDSLAHRNDIVPPGASDPPKDKYRATIRLYCPEVFAWESAVDRAAAMVVAWNRRIHEATIECGCPYYRYQVEDLDWHTLVWLLRQLGIHRSDDDVRRALESVPTNVNAGRRVEFDVEITNSVVIDALNRVAPGRPPIVNTVMSRDTRRSPETIESMMAPELCAAVRRWAEECWYRVPQYESADTLLQGVA